MLTNDDFMLGYELGHLELLCVDHGARRVYIMAIPYLEGAKA